MNHPFFKGIDWQNIRKCKTTVNGLEHSCTFTNRPVIPPLYTAQPPFLPILTSPDDTSNFSVPEVEETQLVGSEGKSSPLKDHFAFVGYSYYQDPISPTATSASRDDPQQQQELEHVRKEYESQLLELRRERETLERDYKEQLSQLRQELDVINKKNSNHNSKTEELERQLSQLRIDLRRQYELDLATLKDKEQERMDALERQHMQHFETLEQEMETLRAKNTEFSNECEELRREHSEQREKSVARLSELNRYLNDLLLESSELQVAHSQQLQQLKQELEEKNRALEKAGLDTEGKVAEAAAAYRTKYKALEHEYLESKKQLEQQAEAMQSLHTQIKELAVELERLKSENHELREQVCAKEEFAKNLTSELQELTTTNKNSSNNRKQKIKALPPLPALTSPPPLQPPAAPDPDHSAPPVPAPSTSDHGSPGSTPRLPATRKFEGVQLLQETIVRMAHGCSEEPNKPGDFAAYEIKLNNSVFSIHEPGNQTPYLSFDLR